MDLAVLLLADYANVEQAGKLNVMGIFTQITGSDFPVRQPEMHLIIQLNAGPAEYNKTRKLTVKLLNEDATEEVVNWSRDIQIPEGKGGRKVTMNQILRMRDVVFRQPGTYQFYVIVDEDEKGTLPLSVVQQASAES